MTDYFDKLKSVSSGYASLDYEHKNWQHASMKVVRFFINGDPVDALTFLVHDNNARSFAIKYAERLRELIPR